MGVILDDGIQHQIDALEAKGDFGHADQLRAANEVSLESLAFSTSVPQKFQALVRSAADDQLVRKEREEKRERERTREREAEAAYQRMIDDNMLRLRIGGRDVEISQGDLRKAMENRVEDLKERRRQLERRGGSPDEIKRLGDLIDEYEPVIDKTKHGRADRETLDEIEKLRQKDQELDDALGKYSTPAVQASNASRTSYSAEHLSEGAVKGPSLSTTFERCSTPAPQETTTPAPKPSRNGPESDLKSLGLSL